MSEVQDKPTSEASRHGDTLHTTRIRAGKRTYYFDVKADRKGCKYLTITETRTRLAPDGTPAGLDKQKLFVYAEDLYEVMQAMNEAAALMLPTADGVLTNDEAPSDTDALSNINIALSDLDF